MRLTVAIIILCFISSQVVCQDRPFEGDAVIIADNVNNLHGGMKEGSAFMGLIDISASYQPDKNIFKNTTLFTHFLFTIGQAPSEKLIGDAQIVSNIEGRAPLFFYEIWIKQQFDNFFLLAGMHDLNSEFCASENAETFLNSSFGISPALSLNIPVSIYPATTLGNILGYEKNKFSFLTGFYNVNHEFAEKDRFDIRDHGFEHGFLSINELQFRLGNDENTKALFKLGFFFKKCRSGDHIKDGVWISEKNYGAYIISDHLLYNNSETEKAIHAFLQLNINPLKYNYASEYYGTGITVNGFSSKKHTDVIGLATAIVKVNEQNNENHFVPGTYETVVELTYEQTIFKKISIQPDIQYVFNTGGTFPNAFVGIIRLKSELW